MNTTYKILIVDDEKDNVDLLFRLFRRDFEVLKAESGEEALEIVKNNNENLAVIVSDMKMPGMNGAEFLKESIEYSPDSTRIILSGYSDSADLLTAINDAKVYLYLVKPFDHEKLKEHVEIGLELYKQKVGTSEMITDPGFTEELLDSTSVEKTDEPHSFDLDLSLHDFIMQATVLNETENNQEIKQDLLIDSIFIVSDAIAPEGSKALLRITTNKTQKSLTFNGEVARCSFGNPKGMEIKLTDIDTTSRSKLLKIFS